jgi:hypothetical protein
VCDPDRWYLAEERPATEDDVSPTWIIGVQVGIAGFDGGVESTDEYSDATQGATRTSSCECPASPLVQAVLIWIAARKRMLHVPSGKKVAAPVRNPSKAAR